MDLWTLNPYPCGYFSDPKKECLCSFQKIHKYRSKISGPLMDRIDIHVEVPAVSYRELLKDEKAEPSAAIRKRVTAARAIQSERFSREAFFCNAQMGNRQIRQHCRPDAASIQLLEVAINKLGLSARAYNRILKIARTIADLANEKDLSPDHISEAIQYRSLDRKKQQAMIWLTSDRFQVIKYL